MKKMMLTMMAFVLAIVVQGQVETVDTAQFVAVYDYECRTQDDEGQDVTDRMQVVVQVGRTVVKSMPRARPTRCTTVTQSPMWQQGSRRL